ncbi:MAG: aminodeoxychorismate synthase component I [Hyphomicrobiales bacterium]
MGTERGGATGGGVRGGGTAGGGAAGGGVTVDAIPVRPLVRAIPRGWTALRALGAVEDLPHTLFLESAGEAGESCEWTILAFDPLWRLEATIDPGASAIAAAHAPLRRIEGAASVALAGHPLDALAAAWPARVRFDPPPPIPFAGGLAGYLAYDVKDWVERYPSRARREWTFPDLSLGFYDVVWAWKRSTGEGWVVSLGLPETEPAERERRAAARLDVQWRRIEDAQADGTDRAKRDGSGNTAASPTAAPAPRVTSNFTRDEYHRAVGRALEHVAAGDIYQVNLAQRFLVEPAPAAPALYRALREAAPAPFLAYLSLGEGAGIASSSPERFFRIEGERIETWPIKGTRPRGRTPEEDADLAGALRRSEKDRAENVMIVDLERNDLGRICAIGSVHVPALCDVTSHSNVHHLVSRVEGRLRDDVGPADVIRAVFPGGSITGAPKIRAVEIIDTLEPVRRGVYTGAIGYWGVDGDCDWNIAIRTVVTAGGVASFHAGGGIVADSTPEGEYEETLVKASGMMRALGVDPERGRVQG